VTASIESPQSAEELAGDTHTVRQRVHEILHRYPALSPAIVLVLSIIVFSFLSDRFLRWENFSLMTQAMSVIGVLAVGQTLIILTAGIDLSIGATMVLSSMVMSKMVATNHTNAVVALIVGAIVGIIASALNGVLVTRLKLPPFIVTLGTLGIYTAITLIYAQGQTVSLNPNSFVLWTGKTHALGSFDLSNGVILMVLIYVVMSFALRNTAWGRHLYATGDDTEASRLAGIRTDRVILSAYVVAGVTTAFAAWILCGRVGGGDPNSATNANLNSITAVVIGGTSLFGGRGLVVGSLIGASIVQVFTTGLALPGYDPNYQVLAIGVLVIVAVSVDQWIRSVKA
jgi:fructose transport system permease protein